MPKLPARSVRQVLVGSMRGVKPKTHRANPVVTQGQTGQPRADSTAPNPERRCGCGTRHDCATVSAQTTGSFHAAACQKPRQQASRCQSFVLSHVSALRLSRQGVRNRPPATRNRSRALPAACHNGTAPVARSACLPPGVTVRTRQRMLFCIKAWNGSRRGAEKKGRRRGLGKAPAAQLPQTLFSPQRLHFLLRVSA